MIAGAGRGTAGGVPTPDDLGTAIPPRTIEKTFAALEALASFE